MNTIHFTEHIKLVKDINIYIIISDDELFDYIDDILTEYNNIIYESVSMKDNQNTFIFKGTQHYNDIKQILSDLDPLEIERIFHLNN